ncbi:hypothetical protein GALL_434050 [mine drainage metagenome]|uniref:DNA primase DnaG DnaB-binding domain-containing protein n=1 Tax=mine drainage metagenome TaxID=410659 RepID=A0A1J5PTZ4_9ZZZZ
MARVERTALEVMLQLPDLVPVEADTLAADACAVPAYRAVHEAVLAAGGLSAARALVASTGSSKVWVDQVREAASAPVEPLVTELAVAPLPEDRPDALAQYVRSIALKLVDVGLTRQVAEAKGRLQRMDSDADPAAYQEAFATLIALEGRRRQLRTDG